MSRPSSRPIRRIAAGTAACALLAAWCAADPAGATALVPPAPPIPASYVSPFGLSGITPAWTSDLAAREQSYVTGVTAPGGDPTVFPTPADWYDNSNSVWGSPGNASYGPQPYTLPRPTVPSGLTPSQTVEFYRQRVVQAAVDYIGTPYQHHHLPSWNPFVANGSTPAYTANTQTPFPDPMPAGQWAWNPVSTNAHGEQAGPVLVNGTWTMTITPQFTNTYLTPYGQGTGGIDCSDLTTLAYSVGAGFFMNSAVGSQGVVNAAGTYAAGQPIGWNDTATPQFVPIGATTSAAITPVTPQFLLGPNSVYNASTRQRGISTWNQPGSLDYVVSQLEAGDLLYITDTTGAGNTVTHVVMWLGEYGTVVSPSGATLQVPLVISSHDNTPAVLDANEQLPPLYPASGSGLMPPPGVHILPFAQNSWFYSNFSHAMRVLPDGTGQAVPGATLQFGSQETGTSSIPLTATVTNTGTAPLSIPGAPTLTGTAADQFSLSTGGTCAGTTLAPGGTCGIPVRFTPTSAGQQVASLAIPVATFATSTPSPLYITVLGTGAAATSSRRTQSISFALPPTAPLADRALPLSGTASSGLPVSYQSGTTDVCTVSGSTVTLLARGSCTLTATQQGNALFAPAPPVSRTVDVVGSAGSSATAGRPDNPAVAAILGGEVLLLGQGAAGRVEPRVMRNPPAARPAQAPMVLASTSDPVALVATGLRPGASLDARIRIDGRLVTLGQAQSGGLGEAHLPVFAMTRPGTYRIVLVDRDTGTRRFVTLRVGRSA